MEEDLTKVCINCGKRKSLSEFYKRKDSKDGFRNDCKLCNNIKSNKYYKENKSRLSKNHKLYREKYKSALAEYMRQYVIDNKEVCNARSKKHYEDNKELYIKRTAQYYERNKTIISKKARAYREKNKEKTRHYMKEYQRNNMDKFVAMKAKRRAFKKSALKTLTNKEKIELNLYYKLSNSMGINYQVDHVIPLSNGGLHHPNNLQILHKEDNLSKNNRPVYEYKHPRYVIEGGQLIKGEKNYGIN